MTECHVLNDFVGYKGVWFRDWLNYGISWSYILTMFLATGARRDAVDTNILIICYFVLVLGGSLKNGNEKLSELLNSHKKTQFN